MSLVVKLQTVQQLTALVTISNQKSIVIGVYYQLLIL